MLKTESETDFRIIMSNWRRRRAKACSILLVIILALSAGALSACQDYVPFDKLPPPAQTNFDRAQGLGN
jgi:hypothetical protein